MSKSKWLIFTLFQVLLTVNSKPICKFDDDGSKYIECAPGDSDYVLNKGLVSDNVETVSITLTGCRLTKLNKDSFDGLPSLEKLDISHNKLSTIPLGILDKVPRLTNFNASYNFITDLPPGLFDQIPSLIQLDLTENHLKKIHPGLIKKTSLLYLSKNLLQGKGFHRDVFETSDINFMLLNGNNMDGAPDNLLRSLGELVYLNLDSCYLTEVPKFLTTQNLDTITHLTLAGNKIRKINNATVFGSLNGLEVLNLTNNVIELISADLFMSLKKLKNLDLSINRLSSISEHQFRNLPLLTDINLSNNLITMLPVNAFRGTKLTNLNMSDNKITYLQDNFCLELKNSGTILARFYFSRNPWQCACLKQLLREVNIMNVQYERSNYDGEHPVCVTTGQLVCKRQEYENQIFIDMYYDMQGQSNI